MPILRCRLWCWRSAPRSLIASRMRIAAAMARSGGLESRHHGIANGLHDGASFGGDDLLQQPEMLVDEIEGDEVADPVIERGRAFEIAEQKSQAQDLEALADGEGVGPVDVAKGLIGEEALGVENGLASLEEAVQRLIRYPHSRQHATIAAIVQG